MFRFRFDRNPPAPLPGALVCTTCARVIASTPAGYVPSQLTPEQLDEYVCFGCRYDADPARSAEVTARFSASKAAAAAARLSGPLRGLSPCSCTVSVTCASCLQTLAAEVSCGRRVAHDYLDTCATNGQHHDLDAVAACPEPGATVVPAAASPSFCEHARPTESCFVHAKPGVHQPMPVALARCESCGAGMERTAAIGACTAGRKRPR